MLTKRVMVANICTKRAEAPANIGIVKFSKQVYKKQTVTYWLFMLILITACFIL